MKPGFILNCHNREQNPCFEAHDPSMMRDPLSGLYYSYCTDSAITSDFRQGIPIRRSRNLIDFTYVGTALSEKAVRQARDNGEYPPTKGFWAPFVEYAGGEYRMYYSATRAFGSSESKIWLAAARSPEGPFENVGVVMDTWSTSDDLPNAIDPHVIDDRQGRKYLVYGSFFGGIYIKELDPETGLALGGDERGLGVRIAVRPENYRLDGPEGASVIYNRAADYYYLFLSYGWLGENYDIRVGRSREVTGPYLDFEGHSLDGCAYGLKLAGSYCFTGGSVHAKKDGVWEYDGFRAPGHGVPFCDGRDGSFYFIHHIRDGSYLLSAPNPPGFGPEGLRSYKMHYMMVRRMFFVDGWPVLSPEPYCGESPEDAAEDPDTPYEWIILDDSSNDVKRPVSGRYSDYGPQRGKTSVCYDFENSRESVCYTGITEEGVCVWGKRSLPGNSLLTAPRH